MRLTERRLRRIIRDVIAESMRRHPDTAEEVHQFHQDLRDRIAQDEEDEMYRLEQEELDREEMFIKNETEMYRTLSPERLEQECRMHGLPPNCTVEQLVRKKYEELNNMS
tara:strand:+ start:400 stop:729 length:330 start_codon:yes stop_codon:yes gene_type:complete